MARNQEKAQSMLNRFLAVQHGTVGGTRRDRRPDVVTEVTTIHDAEKWRNQVVREISRKIVEVQNGGLGEPNIRDLNDSLNDLIKKKKSWERRLLELGGRDYVNNGPEITDIDGKTMKVRGSDYVYFGAARELPGVRELLEKQQKRKKKRKLSPEDILARIDARYYGYDEDDDKVLAAAEFAEETRRLKIAMDAWEEVELEEEPEIGDVEEFIRGVEKRAQLAARKKEALAQIRL